MVESRLCQSQAESDEFLKIMRCAVVAKYPQSDPKNPDEPDAKAVSQHF
jgi:hypothetical protein